MVGAFFVLKSLRSTSGWDWVILRGSFWRDTVYFLFFQILNLKEVILILKKNLLISNHVSKISKKIVFLCGATYEVAECRMQTKSFVLRSLSLMSWKFLTTDPRGVPRSTHDLAVLLFLLGAAVIFTFERGEKVRMTMAGRGKFPSIVCGGTMVPVVVWCGMCDRKLNSGRFGQISFWRRKWTGKTDPVTMKRLQFVWPGR